MATLDKEEYWNFGYFKTMAKETKLIHNCKCSTCLRYEDCNELPDGTAIVFCNFGTHGKMFNVDMNNPLCGCYEERKKSDA